MRSVVCLHKLKTAAVYFDRVIPLGVSLEDPPLIYGLTLEGVTFPGHALASIIFDRHYKNPSDYYTQKFHADIDAFEQAFYQLQHDHGEAVHLRVKAGDRVGWSYNHAFLADAYVGDLSLPHYGSARSLYAKYLELLDAENADFLIPQFEASFRRQLGLGPTRKLPAEPMLSLTHVPLIDAESASWDQILELRADTRSRLTLQRFRSFVDSTYQGKTTSFIEDDVAKRFDDYELVRRKHGFETIHGTLSAILNSNSIIGVAAASMCFALLGEPLASVTSATTIELGVIALEIAKRRHALNNWHHQHEVAYIINTKSRLATKQRVT